MYKGELNGQFRFHGHGKLYHAPLGLVNLDSARQSQIEAKRSDRRSPAPRGQGEEEERFGEVAASPNSPNLTERGIYNASGKLLYEGEFRDGLMHGYGISYQDTFPYVGQFQNGLKHGWGRIIDFSGDLYYEGGFWQGEMHGWGTIVGDENEDCWYEGEMQRGLRQGKGKRIYSDGAVSEGFFINGRRADNNIADIGSYVFASLLFSFNRGGRDFDCTLGVFVDFLQKTGRGRYAEELSELYQRFIHQPDEQEESARIYNALMDDYKPALLHYDYDGHATLLRLVREQESIIIEIYNTGDGLQRHRSDPIKGKYQTVYKIGVPLASVASETIEDLCFRPCSVENFYQQFLDLPGAVKIDPAPEAAIWQAGQRGNNCTLKCILSYLKHRMPPDEYDRFCCDLCKASEADLKNHPENDRLLTQADRDRIAAKIRKIADKVF